MSPDPDRRALAASFAPDVPPKPAPGALAPPIGWILGPELVASLKRLLLYALYRGDLDLRDWMTAEPLVLEPRPGAEELWIDYISDVGDGHRGTYTTALVCQDDLYVAADGAAALPALRGACPDGMTTLRRGQVLIVGGDAAYPVADTATLDRRLRAPFVWAYRDLVAAGRLVDDQGQPRELVDLVGVPSEHDYFDQLVGWNRLFRAPLTDEGVAGPAGRPPPLSLPGFRRRQSASYFALRLPWDWQLWAIDPAEEGIDLRQQWFFRHHGAPDKLILVTPSPTFALGRKVAGPEQLRSLERLGLDEPPPPGACRLEVAGDLHHYERYAPSGEEAAHTAVVAGGGGAFHHPSFQDFGEVPLRAVHPAPAISRRATADALFHPLTIFQGGVLGPLTFLFAVLVCGASFTPGTRALTDTLLRGLGVAGLPAPDWDDLRGAAALIASIIVAAGLVSVALRFVRFRLAWILGAGALALPAVTPILVPRPGVATVLFQTFSLVCVAVIGVALVALAVRVGAGHSPPRDRWRFLTFGLWHAGLQLLLPLLVARLGFARPIALTIAIVFSVTMAFAGRACLRAGWRRRLLAAWIVQGAGVVAILALGGGSVAAAPATAAGMAAFLLGAGIVGAVSGCLQYAWYLAVAAAHDGHNNEVGAATRIEAFRQFVRLRVEPDRLTGYVIAIDEPATEPSAVRPRVVDTFTVGRR